MNLKLLLTVLLVPIFMFGCTVDRSTVIEVSVDGVTHVVGKMRGEADNNYVAQWKNLWGGRINPNIYVRNIKAIELVSGCKVINNSIVNQGLVTMASVEC